MVVKFDDIYIRLDIRHHHNVTERQKRHNNIALCMLARADVQYKLIAILYHRQWTSLSLTLLRS